MTIIRIMCRISYIQYDVKQIQICISVIQYI